MESKAGVEYAEGWELGGQKGKWEKEQVGQILPWIGLGRHEWSIDLQKDSICMNILDQTRTKESCSLVGITKVLECWVLRDLYIGVLSGTVDGCGNMKTGNELQFDIYS